MSEQDDNQEDGFAEEKLIQAIENQIEARTRAPCSKLTLVGYERDEALGMMAYVLAHEINAMLAADRAFDSAGYEHALRALPTLPDDE
ncbi:hypothetical protein [Pseudomonas aeruginosa]|uniref:hypothetical protein n=1 Tax=Pseudomonas aeruginosa TaxID=287 RepID=UPI0011C785C6|nr:hypothetical protein [Pseudomonas aeruginosa]QEF87180.1 hypothetical protein DBX32_29255 [Pseudomonas aeruginosa]